MIDELNGEIDFRILNIKKWKRRLVFEPETKLLILIALILLLMRSLLPFPLPYYLNHFGSVLTCCSKRDHGRVLQNILTARQMCLRITPAKSSVAITPDSDARKI